MVLLIGFGCCRFIYLVNKIKWKFYCQLIKNTQKTYSFPNELLAVNQTNQKTILQQCCFRVKLVKTTTKNVHSKFYEDFLIDNSRIWQRNQQYLTKSQIYIINSEMYELSEKANNKFGQPLLTGDHEIVVPNNQRTCTDMFCFIFFVLCTTAFIGLLTYGLLAGDPKKVINVYNINLVQCYKDQTYPYGFFPKAGSLSNAVCVQRCPSENESVPCLPDSVNCIGPNIIANYSTASFQNYCIPTLTINNQDLAQAFNSNILSAWAIDMQRGWMVLAAAAVISMVASLLFLLVIRCCSGTIIWVSIFICVTGLELIGIMFILEAKGISINNYITEHLTKLSYDSMIIVGSGFIAGGVLIALISCCLRSRIALGSKSVQLGSIFLFQNCCVILLPITQAIFVAAGLGAIVIGGIYLYSLGNFTFPDAIAFPVIALPASQIAMFVIFLFSGFWLVFFFLGCNSFILCSAASIWYFNHNSNYDAGAPFGDSLTRLVCYHPGSVAITALINCIFEILRMIANLLSFEAGEEDTGCTALCLKCLNFLFCIFKCFLRFLNDGTYVQIAIRGTGYCASTHKAYNILADNVLKLSITDGISLFFKILGILGIGVGVTVGAYFSCQEIKYLAQTLTNPLVVTIVAGLIAFVVAGIYLSLIDLSAQAIIQCYLIDHEHCNGYPRYARAQFKDIILQEGE